MPLSSGRSVSTTVTDAPAAWFEPPVTDGRRLAVSTRSTSSSDTSAGGDTSVRLPVTGLELPSTTEIVYEPRLLRPSASGTSNV